MAAEINSNLWKIGIRIIADWISRDVIGMNTIIIYLEHQ